MLKRTITLGLKRTLGLFFICISIILTGCNGVDKSSSLEPEIQPNLSVEQLAYRNVKINYYDSNGEIYSQIKDIRIKDEKGTKYIQFDDLEKLWNDSIYAVSKDDINKKYKIDFVGYSYTLSEDCFEITSSKRIENQFESMMSTWYTSQPVDGKEVEGITKRILSEEVPYPLIIEDQEGVWLSFQTLMNTCKIGMIDTGNQIHIADVSSSISILLAYRDKFQKYELNPINKEVLYKEMVMALRKYYTFATMKQDAIDAISTQQAIDEVIKLDDDAFYEVLEERFNSVELSGHQWIVHLGNQKSVNKKGLFNTEEPDNGFVWSEPSVKILSDGWGYMVLPSFDEGAYSISYIKFIQDSLNTLKASEHIVIDMRHNGGGISYNAFDLIEKISEQPIQINFLKNGEIYQNIYTHKNPAPLNVYQAEVIILVDGWSASTTNIFASVVKENGLGIVMGQRTGGLAASVTLCTLSDGTLLSMNTGDAYLSPSNQSIEEGVEPDIYLNDQEIALPIDELIEKIQQSDYLQQE